MKTGPQEDAELRTETAARLSEQMARNARLLARCEALASSEDGDPVAALNAASRLIKADAAVAAMLARLGHVETRHRALVDVNKPAKESQAELNRKKFFAGQAQKRDAEKRFWELLDLHVSNAIRHRMGDASVEDRIAYALKSLKRWEEGDRAAGWAPDDEQENAGTSQT